MDNAPLSRNKLPTTVLFPSKERWGWRFRDLNTAAIGPFQHNRPCSTMPELFDELSFRKKQEARKLLCIISAIVVVIISLVNCGISSQLSRTVPPASSTEEYTALAFPIILMILAVLAAGAILYVGIWLNHRAYRQYASKMPRNPQWSMQYAEDLREYEDRDQNWQKNESQHFEAFRNYVESLPEWGVLRPQRTTGRVDVYGGSLFEWEALIGTLGSSILGSGSRLSIIDLTQSGVAGPLYKGSSEHGFSSLKMPLPEQQKHFNLLQAMSEIEVTDMLVEALHSDDKEQNKEGRAIDTRIIRGICDCLSQRLTMKRIHAGLLVLLRQRKDSTLFTQKEEEDIVDLFREDFLLQIQQRLVALETQLYDLRYIGEQSDVEDDFSKREDDLGIIELSETGSTLHNDIFVSLLIQRQVRLLRNLSQKERSTHANVLMVAGVDSLKPKLLERLDNLSKRHGIRLIYLFEHLRHDALELLGGSSSTTVFMRLGNPDEAEAAAKYIGRGYKFVMNGYSEHESVNVGETKGTSQQFGKGISGHSPWWANSWSNNFSEGTNKSQSIGITWGTNRNYGRVYEFEVEPTTLQNLDEMALLFVEKGLSNKGRPMQLEQNSGRQRVQIGYCDPDLLFLPRVSPDPLPNWEDGDR